MPIRLVAFLMAVASTVSAGAECITMSAEAARRHTVVFRGTVAAIVRTADLGYKATFNVETVWKGSVTRQFDAYVWELPPELPRFEAGRSYVVVADPLRDRRARQALGLIDDTLVAYGPAMCSDIAPTEVERLGTANRHATNGQCVANKSA